MKNISFRTQVIVLLSLALVLWICATAFDLPLLFNLSWILYGLGFLIHPAIPSICQDMPNAERYIRISGALCILVGLILRTGI